MLKVLKSATENRLLIKKILEQLGEVISNKEVENSNCGLLSGLTGDLLFLYHLSQYDPDLVDSTVFNNKLEFLQQQLPTTLQNHDLQSGFSGQGWFLEYLNQQQGSNYDPELCEEIDSILKNILSVDTWEGEIEMVLGLGGPAIYAARRQKHCDAMALFEPLLRHYENTSTQIGDTTLTWSQPANSVYRFNKDNPIISEYNLGLAHGVPGIVAAIIPALKIPELYQRTKTLLVQSCDWLLEQELVEPQRKSCFSTSCNDNRGSRLGWCYGDLTIALTLYRVGQQLESPLYIDKAKQVALHAANRDSQEGMVDDTGLCHGSAGLTLIFQLLHGHLGEAQLETAANKWLMFTLNQYSEKGLPGFYMPSYITDGYEESTGLLMGYSGIGLCLLAALGQDVGWADCLLMA